MAAKYQIGSIVFGDWVIKEKIGEGSFGKVYHIEREDFNEVFSGALKVITIPQNDAEVDNMAGQGMTQAQVEQYFYTIVEDIAREFAIMAKLDSSPNVVGYKDHKVIRHEGKIGWDILIRMELLTPLLPYAYGHPFSRRQIIRLGIDMCKALELCQKYNIIHRDIKPENIFVSDSGDFKLGDFGIARTTEKTMAELSKKGTYNYMAPEVYLGHEYGFGVDIYSLGIVLYRLLNRNRIPFYPPFPDPITHTNETAALAKRMSGEPIPRPYYEEGRLSEIVLKACSFSPKDRYSSPTQMRQELEAILYDQTEANLIYPDGDLLTFMSNEYIAGKQAADDNYGEDLDGGQTELDFQSRRKAQAGCDQSKTESAFGKEEISQDKTESSFSRRKTAQAVVHPSKTRPKAKKKTPMIVGSIVAGCAIVAGAAFFVANQHQKQIEQEQQAEIQKQTTYQQLMTDGSALCETNPAQALSLFLQAQGLYPDEPAPYTSYAYALYCNRDYVDCISYIEDDLAMGKSYEVEVQNQLSEILGAAYFELEDYAAAASFFRLSTAGGDITVSAMRDYAVSLGRLGSVDEANEVLQRMFDAGAEDDVTDYVQAEVNYAQTKYLEAENGFSDVLNHTDDVLLQKRALRSLAELYRDCAGLAREGKSPISTPATKEVELLADGIAHYGLRYDSTLWEMLALAYFEAYHTDPSVSKDYLVHAAECFNRVIELGVVKEYLYSNLYTIYYELEDYTQAEQALLDYQTAFPDDYMPHALRGMMLITIENGKSQQARDYQQAKAEYDAAGKLLRSADDTTYYQQLESLIRNLENEGWL